MHCFSEMLKESWFLGKMDWLVLIFRLCFDLQSVKGYLKCTMTQLRSSSFARLPEEVLTDILEYLPFFTNTKTLLTVVPLRTVSRKWRGAVAHVMQRDFQRAWEQGNPFPFAFATSSDEFYFEREESSASLGGEGKPTRLGSNDNNEFGEPVKPLQRGGYAEGYGDPGAFFVARLGSIVGHREGVKFMQLYSSLSFLALQDLPKEVTDSILHITPDVLKRKRRLGEVDATLYSRSYTPPPSKRMSFFSTSSYPELTRLRTIQSSFYYSAALVSLNLSTWSSLVYIGDGFLRECRVLKTVDLSGLGSLTEIGDSFLSECPGLESVNLSGLGALKKIGKDALKRSGGPQLLDCSPLRSLVSIGSSFLSESGVTQVNLKKLRSLRSVGNNFLSACRSLQSVELPNCDLLIGLGQQSLTYCISLSSVQIGSLHSVGRMTSLPMGFLSDSRVSQLHVVGSAAACHAAGALGISLHQKEEDCEDDRSGPSELQAPTGFSLVQNSVVYVPLVNLIGSDFATRSTLLRTVELRSISSLTMIQDRFLQGCPLLQQISLIDLPRLNYIGSHALSNCGVLHTAVFSRLSSLTSIGTNFLERTRSLRLLDCQGLATVSSVGANFLSESSTPQKLTNLSPTTAALGPVQHRLQYLAVYSMTFGGPTNR